MAWQETLTLVTRKKKLGNQVAFHVRGACGRLSSGSQQVLDQSQEGGGNSDWVKEHSKKAAVLPADRGEMVGSV